MKKRGNSELALASGVIGRYVYVQLLGQQSELENIAERMLKLINDSFQRRNLTVTSEEKASYFKRALAIAGVPDDIENINPFTALFSSIIGDFRLTFNEIPIAKTNGLLACLSFSICCIHVYHCLNSRRFCLILRGLSASVRGSSTASPWLFYGTIVYLLYIADIYIAKYTLIYANIR